MLHFHKIKNNFINPTHDVNADSNWIVSLWQYQIENIASKDVDIQTNMHDYTIPKYVYFFHFMWSIFLKQNLKAVRQKLIELSCHNKKVNK